MPGRSLHMHAAGNADRRSEAMLAVELRCVVDEVEVRRLGGALPECRLPGCRGSLVDVS